MTRGLKQCIVCAGANITLYYYAGFAYLMQQRHLDAATCFNTILGYISRYHHDPPPPSPPWLSSCMATVSMGAIVESVCGIELMPYFVFIDYTEG